VFGFLVCLSFFNRGGWGFWLSYACGVGHNEDPVPDMRGTKGGSRDTVPFRIVPDLGKINEDTGKTLPVESRHIFDNNELGKKNTNNSFEFRPKPSRITFTFPFSRKRNWLAGESPADNIDLPVPSRREGPHIFPSPYVRPMLLQYPIAVIVNFHLP